MVFERESLKKSRISDIAEARFFAGSKESAKPNTVVTRFGEEVSRVQIVGSIVEKFNDRDGRFGSITIDDGTDSIQARFFGEDIKTVNDLGLGDVVSVTGRMKNYNEDNYISPDFVRKLDDPNSEAMFKLEVLNDLIERKKIVDDLRNLRDEMSQEELRDYASEKYGMGEEILQAIIEARSAEVDYKPVILDMIDKLDQGDGVEIGKLLEAVKLDESMVESAVNDLLGSGEIYEPIVGKFRRVG